MYVLGIHGGHKHIEEEDVLYNFRHDAAAVLMEGRNIIAAIEEERLNRSKHTNCFPVNAIRSCLRLGGITWEELDIIAFNGDAPHLEKWLIRHSLADTSFPVHPDAASVVSYLFESNFRVDVRSKVHFCPHHLSHAYSAYAVSGFSDSLILSIDGSGDSLSGMVLRGSNCQMSPLRKILGSQSLGLLYIEIIGLLGFGLFDEYKAMGLAPYGDRRVFRKLFQQGFKLLPSGEYYIAPLEKWMSLFKDHGILSKARRQGEEFAQVHMDIAAALQEMIEETVMHILRYFRSCTNVAQLCIAGGVAHNSTLNGRILYEGLFDHVFVQPAAHDAGGALGAALSVTLNDGRNNMCTPLRHVALGANIGNDIEIGNELSRWTNLIELKRTDDVIESAAQLLADGAVIGWVQGRSEFGPRALGHRSILADPRPSSNKQRINAMIKKREAYRPFAPSVLNYRASEFFEIPETKADLSFMTYVLRVKEEKRVELGAVTHINGTARVQVVSSEQNPTYFKLIEAFGRITGTPLLLNTSFNNNAEPIVDSTHDAVRCFLTSDLDALVVGPYIVRKRGSLRDWDNMRKLKPVLTAWSRLEKADTHKGIVMSVTSRQRTGLYRVPRKLAISDTTFNVLALADGEQPIETLVGSSRVGGVVLGVLRELVLLWSERLVDLIPPHAPRPLNE